MTVNYEHSLAPRTGLKPCWSIGGNTFSSQRPLAGSPDTEKNVTTCGMNASGGLVRDSDWAPRLRRDIPAAIRLEKNMYSSLLDVVRRAWSVTPYPGDRVLGDCWCDECEFSVRNLRGKAWKEIVRSDINGENSEMSDSAFLYYLPALLQLSLADEDDTDLSSLIMGRFLTVQMEPATQDQKDQQRRVQRLSRQLSTLQRTALSRYFEWVGQQGWQFPKFTNVARKCVLEGVVEPVPYAEVMAWAHDREREVKKPAG
jgi:hypothetical protein